MSVLGVVGFEEALPHLSLDVSHPGRRVGDKDCGGRVLGSNIFEHVEVLCHHHKLHHIGRGCAIDALVELDDTFLQPFDDGLALPGHTLAGKFLGLGIRLSRLPPIIVK